MPLQHTLGPRHWRIEEDDGRFLLKSKKREERDWELLDHFGSEDEALAVVQKLPESFPQMPEASGHFAGAFERKYWKRVD